MKFISTHKRESGKFLPWIPESGTLITIGIQNTSSTDKYWNPVYLESGIHSVESRIQDSPGFPYIRPFVKIQTVGTGTN